MSEWRPIGLTGKQAFFKRAWVLERREAWPRIKVKRGRKYRIEDVVVVGAGAIGASIALFCKRLQPGLRVTVVDPDPLGGFSASATAGSCGSRRLFRCPENIAMSDYSIKFFEALDAQAAHGPGTSTGAPKGICSSFRLKGFR